MRVDVDENFLDRDFARLVGEDNARQVAQDKLQPLRQFALGIADAAAGHVLELAAGSDDDAEPGDAQAGIDAEDAAYGQPDRALCKRGALMRFP